MATYAIELPWHTARLNQLMGRHWAKGAKRKREDATMVRLLAAEAGVPLATCRRRVSLLVRLPRRGRPADPDAYWKSLLDALVRAKLLVDDSPRWCELGLVWYERSGHATMRVTLEDLD